MKYTLLLISFFIFFNYSCKKSSIKENPKSIISESINNTENSNSNLEKYCKVTVKGKDIIIDCERKMVYSNLIIDEMSVSTEFIQGENNTFSLLYELNASVTKVKEKYDFIYSNKGLRLVNKEVLKYGKDGISLTKVYFKKYMMESKSFDDLQSLASTLQDDFNENPLGFLYDNQQKLFGKEIYNLTSENFFINYPNVKQPNLEIINVELANNLAFDLQNENVSFSSKLILEKIIEKYPNRVVAWLNLGDVYWSLGNKTKAKEAYQTYISLMKYQNKNITKIPQRVYERCK